MEDQPLLTPGWAKVDQPVLLAGFGEGALPVVVPEVTWLGMWLRCVMVIPVGSAGGTGSIT